MISNDKNLDFYTKSSVQKIIDMQYVKAKRFGFLLFWVYLLLFLLPLEYYLIGKKNGIGRYALFTSLVTSLIYLSIELIQMYDQ